LGEHRGMKIFNTPASLAKRHPLAAACVVFISAIALAGCAVQASPDASSMPAPAPVNTAPVATMKGPLLSAPIGTSNPARPSTPTGPINTTSLMRDIAAEIGDAACDTDSQCRTLGVGSKACGGPEGYVAWSSKVNDAGTRLKALAAAHSTERDRENERSGMRSNCSVTPDPGAVCRPRVQDGLRVCQVVQGRRSGAV
jgi:hypothetical protein